MSCRHDDHHRVHCGDPYPWVEPGWDAYPATAAGPGARPDRSAALLDLEAQLAGLRDAVQRIERRVAAIGDGDPLAGRDPIEPERRA